jgi:hypothetical protein
VQLGEEIPGPLKKGQGSRRVDETALRQCKPGYFSAQRLGDEPKQNAISGNPNTYQELIA